MTMMTDLRKDAKKLAADLKSNKNIDDASKKALQGWLDKIDDKLCDLAPRRDDLDEQINGKTLDNEISKYNNDQDKLKPNGDGLRNALKDAAKKSKDMGSFAKDAEKFAVKISGLSNLKR